MKTIFGTIENGKIYTGRGGLATAKRHPNQAREIAEKRWARHIKLNK